MSLGDDDQDILAAELESWPERATDADEPDWLFELPESAAAENASDWTDD